MRNPPSPIPADLPESDGPARRLWDLWRQGRRPDLAAFLAGAGELTRLGLLGVLRVDQRERWLRGERAPAEAYLERHAALRADDALALDLVYSEFLLREELGESPAPGEYAGRFPAFAEEFRRQVEIHWAACPPGPAAPPFGDRPTVPAAADDEPGLPSVPGYEVLGELGRGGMGVVYKARQVGLDRLVALKMIRGGHVEPEQRQRFRAEAVAAARLRHPNIVQIYEVGEHAGRPYFSMEYVEGGSLDRHLTGTPQPAPEAARLVETLARAVHAAHQCGIIHRDLKPANVLLRKSLTQRRQDAKKDEERKEEGNLPPSSSLCVFASLREALPKITDFGLAKQLDADLGQTRSGAILGTPSYMAPEQAAGRAADIGPATDVYALGAILYECLTGRPPFTGTAVLETLEQVRSQEPVPPHRLRPNLPRDLETVCLKCLEKDPRRRYGSAEDVAEDLARFLQHRPVRARPVGPAVRLGRWGRRNPVLAGMAALLVLTILAGNVLVTWKWQETEQARQAERQARQEADTRAEEIRQGLERMKAANALVERAGDHQAGRHWDNAEADFTRALRLRPEDPRVWLNRGYMYCDLGLWDLADSDFARSFELQEPVVPWAWHRHALLRLHAGDVMGYRQLCARMRQRFGGTTNVESAFALVRTCAMVPEGESDPSWLVEVGQSLRTVQPKNEWRACELAVAYYRAGQYEQAVRQCQDSLALNATWQLRAANCPILAMARHRLGQEHEAREALDEAARVLDRGAREMYQGGVGFWPGIAWWDWLESQLHYREAREELGLPPPPDDPRCRFLRGSALSYLQRQTEAAAEFDAALKLGMNDPQVRQAAHHNQAHRHIDRQEWDQVQAEFAQAVAAQPDNADEWRCLALAHQAAGDAAGYRQVCAEILRRFAKTTDPDTADYVVRACVLTPDAAAADPAALVALARVAVPLGPGNGRCLGAALYRAGRDEEAVDCFRAAARVTRPSAWDWLFLAMAHARLGQEDEARRCLARADAWVREAGQPDANDLSGTQPTWNRWFERTEVEVLRREAVTLLPTPPPAR